MAPTTRKGSAPDATSSGSGASGGSWDRCCSQAKNRITALERVEHRALRNLALNIECHLAVDVGQRSQMRREYDSDHKQCLEIVDVTAGRTRPSRPLVV